MNSPLATYLHDHLAGAAFALNLLDTLREEHRDDHLGAFAAGLHTDIEEDRSTLELLIQRAGGKGGSLKGAAGWLGEKASRLKLRHQVGDPLGTFEALETLATGILAKRGLWTALATIAPGDARFADINLERLIRRAEDQFSRVEARRLAAAPAALHEDTEHAAPR